LWCKFLQIVFVRNRVAGPEGHAATLKPANILPVYLCCDIKFYDFGKEEAMTVKSGLPGHFVHIRARYRKFFEALDELGRTARQEGPLDERTAHLVQLAASAAIRSEGAVHSHTRRALDAGAAPDEIYHTIILLTSTIGFPNAAAALSWIEDVIENKPEEK